jgi:hypothetical protein
MTTMTAARFCALSVASIGFLCWIDDVTGAYRVTLLNPTGITSSFAIGASDDNQVGLAATSMTNHAMLWSGTAEGAVDLHPAGFYSSFAAGVDGNSQVGFGNLVPSALARALLWHGSADSVVNLHPAGYIDSGANDVFDTTQVGPELLRITEFLDTRFYGEAQPIVSWTFIRPVSARVLHRPFGMRHRSDRRA